MELIGNKYFHGRKHESNSCGDYQMFTKEPIRFLWKERNEAGHYKTDKEKSKHHWKRRKIIIETSKEIKPEEGKYDKDYKA